MTWKEVIEQKSREFDRQMEESDRVFDQWLEKSDQAFANQRQRLRKSLARSHYAVMATIIICNLALAAYMTIFMVFIH